MGDDFLDMPYGDMEKLNLEAKRLREGSPGDAEAEHTEWLGKQDGVKAVTVCFPDLEGRLHMLDYDKAWLLKHAGSLTFDGSSVRGFSEIGDSDLRLEVDWPAFWRLPADVFGSGKTLAFAAVRSHDGSPYPADFRGRLAALAGDLAGRGLSVRAAMEIEGFLVEGRNAEQEYASIGRFDPASSRGYFHSLPGDDIRRFIDAVARAQRAMGFENEKDHPEVAPSQFELNWSHAEMRIAADQALLYKLVCRQVADRMGMTASFLPKPVAGINGNGMHTNLSIRGEDGNLFAPANPGEPLSERGMLFVRRVLARAREMCLVLNPSVNSYRRLDPAFEAPTSVGWSVRDRSAMIRVPLASSAEGARVEVRSVSPDASPHMLLHSLVSIGAPPSDAEPGPPQGAELCGDIHEALKCFTMGDVLGPEEARKYAGLKRSQARRCPVELGSLVKRGEVMFHHEVTNQSLWGRF